MPRGRLEGTITVPSGWTFSATNGTGGPSTVTVPATSYSVTAYCTALQTALNTDRPSGWTVTPSFGESGTGLVTINCSSTNWAITWTTAEIGSQIGHTNITARASSLAGGIVPGVWMPDCAYWSPYDVGDQGHYVSDMRQMVSPLGHVKTLYGNKMRVLAGLKWEAVSKDRVKLYNIGASYQPFESWWLATQLGESYVAFTPGSVVYFFPSADSATSTTYKILDMQTFAPQTLVNGWAGRFRVEIPRMVVTP